MQNMTISREKKYIFIIGGVLLLLGTLYNVAPYLGNLLPNKEEITVKAKRLAKYQEKVRTRESLHQSLVSLTRRLERSERALLKAETPTLAAVDIQNRINEIVSDNNLEVMSLSVLKSKESGVDGFLSVPVQVNMKLTIRQLIHLLHKIESAPQLLTVAGLTIRKLRSTVPGELQAALTVTGYMKNK